MMDDFREYHRNDNDSAQLLAAAASSSAKQGIQQWSSM